MKTMCAIVMVLFFLSFSVIADEPHTESIIEHILKTRQAILNQTDNKPTVFLAFWDFDGTILKGDCSEGLVENGDVIYPGLSQVLINAGLSSIYLSNGGFKKFAEDYVYIGEHIGKWMAYPFNIQIFRGTEVSALRSVAEKHFREVLSKYYFTSSIQILKALKENEIESYIISASPELFIEASASTVGLDIDRLYGIEVKLKNFVITEEISYPITWAEGKVLILKNIVEKTIQSNPDKNVVVLAAFGDSYSTDGPFLKYVATQSLPAGEPISVMINGGKEPNEYYNLFRLVIQNEIFSQD